MANRTGLSIVLATAVAVCGCQSRTLEEAEALLAKNAEKARRALADLSFEEYLATVPREDDGSFTVNGDTPIENEKLLREFFENNVHVQPKPPEADVTEFAISVVGGSDEIWTKAEKRSLTYCVSKTAFGARYDKVVRDMQDATAAWEAAADVDFTHVVAEDAACTNASVLFDVRPVDRGTYLARAFYPRWEQSKRHMSIDESSFRVPPEAPGQLVGILRHELGHVLGGKHEHTRPEAGQCFDDNNWRKITSYDKFSVMHYPQCTDDGNVAFTLSDRDKSGIACVYGPATGFTVNVDICKPLPGSSAPQAPSPAERVHTVTFDDQTVALDEQHLYDDLDVANGTPFVATIEGIGPTAGDPDLYVKFDDTPAPDVNFDCRPFKTGANERCTVDVPVEATVARVMVHGHAAGHYKLSITYTSP